MNQAQIAEFQMPGASVARLWWRQNSVPIVIAFAASLVAYSTLATQFVFTDHTIPNMLVSPYPSFKTQFEGRWFADIIIRLGGGGGAQAFQAIVAFFIQAINGILFSSIVGVRGRLNRTIIALMVSLHPAVLDYYAFLIDDISFTVSDTIILVSVLALDKRGSSWITWIGAGLGFMLALATYQPKIAVIAVVLLAWIVSRTTEPEVGHRHLLRVAISASVSALIGVAMYYVSLKMTLHDMSSAGRRTNINSAKEVVFQFISSFEYTITAIKRQINALPMNTGIAAHAMIYLGIIVTMFRSARKGVLSVAICLISLLLMLPAMNFSAIVNSSSWIDTGRLSIGYTYFMAFMAASLMFGNWLQLVGRFLAAIILYGYSIIAVQENQFISAKTTFENSLMSRILARIEPLLSDNQIRPLIVFGRERFDYTASLLMSPSRPLRPQFSVPAFVSYRQPQLANFLLGREIFRYPTKDETERARISAMSRPSWPHDGSVYRDGSAIVVNLEIPDTDTVATGP